MARRVARESGDPHQLAPAVLLAWRRGRCSGAGGGGDPAVSGGGGGGGARRWGSSSGRLLWALLLLAGPLLGPLLLAPGGEALGVESTRLTDGIEGKETTAEYCASESFDVGCAVDEAILMHSALYGRMKPGRCISAEYDHSIGCYSDVLHYMDSQCSGRQKCKILIATLEAVAQPCKKDFKSYLQATFRCVKVNAARTQTCQSEDPLTLTAPTGIIAGGVTHEMPELLTCRWAVRVRPGQSVGLTLFSFDLITIDDLDGGSLDQSPVGAAAASVLTDCSMQVSVHERQERTKIDVCNVRQREREIYQSESHVVHIEVIVHRSPRRPRFMIKYKATGCPDLEANGETWMNRKAEHLFIRCNETNETWFLTCRGDRWIGEMGNCTADKSWTSEKVFGGNSSFHRAWIVFAIIIGVVIGLLVGTSLLTIALMWRKRNREPSTSAGCGLEDACGPPESMMGGGGGGGVSGGGGGGGGPLGRSSYPALLRQEKLLGSDVSEYTHVWDVQAPVICQDGGPPPPPPPAAQPLTHLHTCKLLQSAAGDYSSHYGNKETCKLENSTNLSTLRSAGWADGGGGGGVGGGGGLGINDGGSGNGVYGVGGGRSGESGYESPSSADEKPNVIPRGVPIYFDMDGPPLSCPHGHTLTRITRSTT